jgi:hypothetical protein
MVSKVESWSISGNYDQWILDKLKAALRSHPVFARSRLDMTLSREWGEAVELSYGARVLRYAFLQDSAASRDPADDSAYISLDLGHVEEDLHIAGSDL